MSTDRELLDLAAKAAGADVLRGYFGAGECWLTSKGDYGLMPWNPLTAASVTAARPALRAGSTAARAPAGGLSERTRRADCWRSSSRVLFSASHCKALHTVEHPTGGL